MITQLPNKSNSNSIAASSGCRLMMLGLASHETRSTGQVKFQRQIQPNLSQTRLFGDVYPLCTLQYADLDISQTIKENIGSAKLLWQPLALNLARENMLLMSSCAIINRFSYVPSLKNSTRRNREGNQTPSLGKQLIARSKLHNHLHAKILLLERGLCVILYLESKVSGDQAHHIGSSDPREVHVALPYCWSGNKKA